MDSVTVSLVNRDGITFSATAALASDGIIRIPLDDLALAPTLLCPAPYPVFLSREFIPEGYNEPLRIADVEKLQFVFPAKSFGKIYRGRNHSAYGLNKFMTRLISLY